MKQFSEIKFYLRYILRKFQHLSIFFSKFRQFLMTFLIHFGNNMNQKTANRKFSKKNPKKQNQKTLESPYLISFVIA